MSLICNYDIILHQIRYSTDEADQVIRLVGGVGLKLFILVARLHDVHGNDWAQIGQMLDRSGQSVRDKFRSLPQGSSIGNIFGVR